MAVPVPPVLDVTVSIELARDRHAVAAFAADPDHARDWYRNIESVTWLTPRPLGSGSRFEFEARFLGRHLRYTYEVDELVPDERLVMRADDGPFPMETTYTWFDAPDGGTRMELRNRGGPTGWKRVLVPVLRPAVRRANTKDLRRLKAALEPQRG